MPDTISATQLNRLIGTPDAPAIVDVRIGMLSPGPVVIPATFVGYLVAGFWGSLVATIGIFLPSFILIRRGADPDPAPHEQERAGLHQGRLRRCHRHDPRGVLPARQDRDRGLADRVDRHRQPALLFRFKVNNPALIGATAAIGLVAFPILQPTWVFVQ